MNVAPVETFVFDPLMNAVVLRMAYARAEIQNPQDWDADARFGLKPTRVDLIYTAYPRDTAKWLTRYHDLIGRRVEALCALDPALRGVEWRLVPQTDGKAAEDAAKMFHGVVIYYAVDDDLLAEMIAGGKPIAPRLVRDFCMSQVRDIVSDRSELADSTVRRAMDRHPEWRDVLLVADWTSSMYAYGADVLRWQEAHRNVLKYLVLFNDGDDFIRPAGSPKNVGATGGFYAVRPTSLAAVLALMDSVILRGDGGDFPENDLEALRWADKLYGGECGAVVLIADNESDVRDLALLPEIKRPVHVILCSPERKPPHPHYLTIAWRTGGSITTLSDELAFERPGAPVPKGGLKLDGATYRLEDGAFKPAR